MQHLTQLEIRHVRSRRRIRLTKQINRSLPSITIRLRPLRQRRHLPRIHLRRRRRREPRRLEHRSPLTVHHSRRTNLRSTRLRPGPPSPRRKIPPPLRQLRTRNLSNNERATHRILAIIPAVVAPGTPFLPRYGSNAASSVEQYPSTTFPFSKRAGIQQLFL